MSLPGLGVLPVDVRLGRRQGGHLGRQPHLQMVPHGPGEAPHHLAHQLVGAGHRPRPVHRRRVDDRCQGLFEDALLHSPFEGLLEQGAIGVMGHHPGPHQAEGGGPDPLEPVVHPHGRLPVRVHPGAPGGLGVGGAVVGGAQHGAHHHRRGDRWAPSSFGVQVGEVLVRDDLVAVVGQALVERALGHKVPPHMASF